MRLPEFIDNFDSSVRVQIFSGNNLLFAGSVYDLSTLLNSEVLEGGVSCEEEHVRIQISDLREMGRASYTDKKEAVGIKRYLLLVTAEDWNHDGDEWLGIYVNDDEAWEAYNRAIAWFEAECESGHYSKSQKVMIYEFDLEDNVFKKVNPQDLKHD